jgi:hypothetical protein
MGAFYVKSDATRSLERRPHPVHAGWHAGGAARRIRLFPQKKHPCVVRNTAMLVLQKKSL